jgi:hypothetical protein
VTPIDPTYLQTVLKALMQAIARERVENYALRLVLAESGVASFQDQDKARAIARKTYAKLLSLVGEDQPEAPDLRDFLKDFEGPIQ